MDKLDRQELIRLVEKIINVEGTEKEIDEWVNVLMANVPHPSVTDLIFYSDKSMSAQEIVDEALSYKTIQL